MKKFIALLCIICMVGLLSTPVFAGDIPEALSYDDDAKVFIGTLLGFSNSIMGSSEGQKEVTVLPTLKLKGDVEVDVDDSYECCYFTNTEPKIGAEYFFGWLSNTSVYAYEVKSRTEDKITLHITDEFSERIQTYLDQGLYQQSEIQRMNVGRRMTLSEYLNSKLEWTEKVTFSLNGTEYDIDAEEFFQFSDNAVVTDVKNRTFNRMGASDWDEDILYITVTHNQVGEGNKNTEFACVTRFCEVDRWNGTLSRLPNCDYTMEWEDLASLYTFLPEDVQKELYAKNMGETGTSSLPIPVIQIFIGVICVLAVGFVIFSIQRKKKQ